MVFGFDLGFGKKKTSAQSDYSKTGTFSREGENTIISPDWWKKGTEGIATGTAGFADKYGFGNVTPEQQSAMTGLQSIFGQNYAPNFLKTSVNPALQGMAQQIQAVGGGANYQLGGATPQVEGQNVTASTAYSMAEPYRAAYGTDVLDTSLADYDTGVARAANAFRAANIGGGAQAAGSQPVAAGVLAADAARGRGSLAADIRSGILDRSFGFGGSDAGMRLSADTTSAANRQAAGMANAQFAQQDRLAQLDADIKSDATKMAAFNQVANLIQAQGDNALAANTAESQNAINALQAAGVPIDQALALIQAQIGVLGAATPGFGQTSTESGTESETGRENQTGKSSGFSFGFTGK